MMLVTTSSAYLRLRAAGLGCEDWPRCYGQGIPALQNESIAAARVAHRLSASAAGAVALLILALAAPRRSRDRQALAVGVALVALAALLAVLGRSTPQATVAAVAMGNLVGGMSMSALFLFLAVRSGQSDRRPDAPAATLTVAAIALTVLQLAYGAMTSASYSGLACTTLPDCAGAWWPADAAWSAFDPWRAVAREHMTANMTLHMVHRYAGALLAVLLLGLGVLLYRRGSRLSGTLVTALVLAQCVIGAVMVLRTLPVALALMHNVLAGLLLVALAGALAGRMRAPEAA